MLKKAIFFVLLAASPFLGLSQQLHYANWAFGSGVKVSFNTGTPVVSCGLPINASEGCASISDPTTGNFIAYTDGATVWNGQNNAVLANGTGLIGSSTSIEAALIIPKPGGTPDQFYVFHNNTTTAYWSEVDMSVGANGTVVSKNNLLGNNTTERMGAVLHANCEDYWVVITANTNAQIAAFHITAAGINPTPVLSNTGIVGGQRRGNIVFTGDYKKMGMNVEGVGMYIFDFNNATGAATNPQKIGTTTSGFGSAFSPDQTKVYYTNTWSANLYQYDLNTGTQTLLGGGASSYPVLAIDGKIYVSRYGQTWLGVVNSPNAAGAACNYVLNGLNLGTCVSRWGLPNPFYWQGIQGNPPTVDPDHVNCFGETSGAASVNTGTITSGFTYAWNNGQTAQTATGLGIGSYTVIVTDANGCKDTVPTTITQPAVLTATTSALPSLCFAGSSGSASVGAAGGTTPYTYSWSSTQTGAAASNLAAGTYTATVLDSNGCVTTALATISQPAAVTPTISAQSNVSCNGGSDGTATASGGTSPYTYTWSNGQSGSTATGLAPGVYTVTATDNNGCVGYTSATITEPPILTVSVSTTSVTCVGGTNGSANANSTGGTSPYNFVWINSVGSTISSATGLPAGNYTVVVSDNNGCTTSATTSIAQPSSVFGVALNGTNTSCFGGSDGSISAGTTGGSPPFSYSWNNGQTGATATGLASGTYTVTVTDNNGCTNQSSLTITSPPALTATVTASTDVSCNAGSDGTATVTANGGTPGYTYNWNTGTNTQVASGLGAGTFTATVTDNNGCSVDASVTINEPPALSLTLTPTDLTCNGNNSGGIIANVNGGTAAYTYNWSNGSTTSTVSALAAGNYNVTVTDSKGCTINGNTDLTQPAALNANLISSPDHCSQGDGTATVISTSGGTPAYTYNWSSGGSGPSVSNLSAGTYTLTITDNNSCTHTETIVVDSQASDTLQVVSISNVSCNAACDGDATLQLSGTGTWPYTYNWNTVPAQTTLSATGLCAGVYTCTVVDGVGCSSTKQITITQPTALTATITAQTNVLCNGNTSGDATVLAGGGTPTYTYNWSNGQSTATASSLGAGTYSITVTDNNACTTQATVTITEPPALSLTLTPNDLTCNTNSSGSITSNVNGGTGPYTYNWSNGSTTTGISSLAAGSYSLTVTDNNGCSIQSSSTLTEPTVLSMTLSSTPDNCSQGDGTASILASGGTSGYTYNWSPSSQTTTTASNLSTGTYTVLLTDNNGCTASNSVLVPLFTADTFQVVSITNASCNGSCDGSAALQLSGTTNGPYTYAWSTAPPQTALTATGLCAGVYTCTMTDGVGCKSTKQVTISQPSILTASITSITNGSCSGNGSGAATVSAAGGTSAYTYNWNNGQTNSSATGLLAGTYTVTVTDNNGCTTQTTATITEPPPLSTTLTPTDLLCNADNSGTITANVTGGNTPYTYNWSNGATSANISGLSAGSYSLTVTDANGCTLQSNSSMTEPSILTLTLSSTDDHCFQGDGTAAVNAGGGTPAYTYNWMPGGQNTATASSLATGNYTLTLTDNNGCVLTNTVLVDIYYSDTLQFVSTQNNSCKNSCDGSATLQLSGAANGPYTYNWNAPGAQTNLTATALCAGVFTCTMTDVYGCIDTMSISITEPALLTTTLSTINTLCFGDSTGSASSLVSGGTSAYTYNWSNTSTAQNISNIPSGLYSLTVTDANGCTTTGNTQVNDAPQLFVNILPTAAVCFGETALLSSGANGGTPAYNYQWNTGQSTSSITTTTLGISTGYTITATDANGCTETDTVIVTVNPLPVPSFTTDVTEGCEPLCVNFTNTSANTQSQIWNFGDGNGDNAANPFHCFTDTGQYNISISVVDNNGCSDSITLANYITVYPNPIASFTMSPQPTTILNPIIHFADQSWQAVQWDWSFGDVASSASTLQNPNYTYVDTGAYLVQLIVTNQYGCLDTIQDTVVIGPDYILFIPNTFTPNGDGMNEVFKPEGIGLEIDEYEFWIFDRWGNLIFKTKDPNHGWDGRANGGSDIAQQDTYVWKIATKDHLGLRHRYVGHVNLIR